MKPGRQIMKAYTVQPPYSKDISRADALFAERLRCFPNVRKRI